MTATTPTPIDRGRSSPRHQPVPRESGVKAYEKALLQAEHQAAQAIDRLLTDYLHLLEVAGLAYAREAERAMRAYNRLEEPARKAYERQLELAARAYDSIQGPADAELARIGQAASDMYTAALTPIESAYALAVQNAQQLTQNVTLGQAPVQ